MGHYHGSTSTTTKRLKSLTEQRNTPRKGNDTLTLKRRLESVTGAYDAT